MRAPRADDFLPSSQALASSSSSPSVSTSALRSRLRPIVASLRSRLRPPSALPPFSSASSVSTSVCPPRLHLQPRSYLRLLPSPLRCRSPPSVPPLRFWLHPRLCLRLPLPSPLTAQQLRLHLHPPRNPRSKPPPASGSTCGSTSSSIFHLQIRFPPHPLSPPSTIAANDLRSFPISSHLCLPPSAPLVPSSKTAADWLYLPALFLILIAAFCLFPDVVRLASGSASRLPSPFPASFPQLPWVPSRPCAAIAPPSPSIGSDSTSGFASRVHLQLYPPPSASSSSPPSVSPPTPPVPPSPLKDTLVCRPQARPPCTFTTGEKHHCLHPP